MTTRRPTKARNYEPLKPRLDVHAAITDKIVAQIEAGAGIFKMPWHRPGISFAIPKNASTDKAYRGSNILSLWIDAEEKKFEHQVWATYKQFAELGAQVRKGEKGSLIVKYGEWVPKSADAGTGPAGYTTTNDDDDAGKRLYAKPAFVFNIDQVGAPGDLRAKLLPPSAPKKDLTERLADVDAFIAAIGIEIREGGQRAYYRRRASVMRDACLRHDGEGDFIQMPPRELFTGTATCTPTEAYYATILHEEIHASGAEHRLKRNFGERFGDQAYAFEELVAELGAAFLCAHLEVTNTPRIDHAQYIASWLKALKDDSKAIFTAASMATRAVDYLCGLQPAPKPYASHSQPLDDQQTFSHPATRPGESERAASAKLGGLDQ